MSTRLFIGNIPEGTQEDDLKKEFGFYGKVFKVDLKEKQDLNNSQNSNKLFAFITLDAKTLDVNKCIQEFSEQKWNGSFLKVSVAKESFLDRLKRERSEAGSPKETKVDEEQFETPKHFETKKNFYNHTDNNHDETKKNVNINIEHIDNKKKFNNHVDHIETKKIFNDRVDYVETKKTFNDHIDIVETKKIVKHVDHVEKRDDFHNKKEKRKDSIDNTDVNKDDNIPLPKKKKMRWSEDQRVSRDIANGVTTSNKTDKEKKIVSVSDKKRLESIQNMKSAYNEKKSLIKIALSGVDTKKNNKIIFNDDEDGNVIITENIETSKGSKSVSNGKANKKSKAALFDDESGEENDTYNFEIKQQFEGESGRKLLELQSRYQSDKRFVLDERFMDVDDNNDESVKKVESDVKEMDTENNDEIDAMNDDEKSKQMLILQGVIGDSRIISIKNENIKKMPQKTMLRFDPSRPDHTKFLNKPAEKSTLSKKSKKEKKKAENAINEKERPDANVAPEVSQERYYKINESLKQSIDDKQPFSLISLFGNGNIEENESPDDEYSTKPIEKVNKKMKNPLGGEKNPFFYDTSDTEDESTKKVKKSNDSKTTNATLNVDATVKSTAIIENFFFSDKDARLLEGLEFFLNAKPSTEKLRRELKSVVKKRIQNNKRNSKFQPKKVLKNHSKTRKFKKR